MTKKKEQILEKALELFANEGYQNTSTRKIACKACVSEGLIFKHFQSKDGLLRAVIDLANDDIRDFIRRVKSQDDPQRVLETAFEFPPLVSKNQDFWKLQFSLKYQCPNKEQYHEKRELIDSLEQVLEEAFRELDYEDPKMETKLFMNIMFELCEENFNNDKKENKEFIDFVKKKYGV